VAVGKPDDPCFAAVAVSAVEVLVLLAVAVAVSAVAPVAAFVVAAGIVVVAAALVPVPAPGLVPVAAAAAFASVVELPLLLFVRRSVSWKTPTFFSAQALLFQLPTSFSETLQAMAWTCRQLSLWLARYELQKYL